MFAAKILYRGAYDRSENDGYYWKYKKITKKRDLLRIPNRTFVLLLLFRVSGFVTIMFETKFCFIRVCEPFDGQYVQGSRVVYTFPLWNCVPATRSWNIVLACSGHWVAVRSVRNPASRDTLYTRTAWNKFSNASRTDKLDSYNK